MTQAKGETASIIPAERFRAAQTAGSEDMIFHILHDLSAGIRSLTQIASWLVEDLDQACLDLPKGSAGHLDLLQSRADRLQAMLRDLADYAALGKGKTPFNGQWDDVLAAVLAEVPEAETFALHARMHGRLDIDVRDLFLLLRALVSNAVKHHHAGAGTILIEVSPTTDGIKLTVTDDGPGIPEDARAEACQIMTTLRPRDEVEGSGMGLPIANKISGLYAGHLEISAPRAGQGCAVTVHLNNPPRDHARG